MTHRPWSPRAAKPLPAFVTAWRPRELGELLPRPRLFPPSGERAPAPAPEARPVPPPERPFIEPAEPDEETSPS